MRLVKISDLSEEERKKALEEQRKRLEENRRASEQARTEANNRFNDLINKAGGFDTTKHTTTIGNLRKAYKNSSSYNEINKSLNNYYDTNKTSMWNDLINTANNIGKITENAWLGLSSGVQSFQQTISRRLDETPANTASKIMEQTGLKAPDFIEESNKKNEEYRNKIQESKEEKTQKINQNIESIQGPISKKLAEISPAIGQMIPGFIPGVGAVYVSGSATGQYYDDAKARGMSDEEANTYAGIMGLAEGGTEMIGIKNLSKAGKTVKALIKGTGKETGKQVAKSLTKQALKEYGIGIADNVIQEAIIDPIQEFTAQAVGGEDKAQWEGLGNRMLEDAINGGLVSAILGGANIGIQSCTGVVQKYKNNEKITQQEFTKAVKDASKQLDTGAMITENIQNEISRQQTTPLTQEKTVKIDSQTSKTTQDNINLQDNLNMMQNNAKRLNEIVDNDKFLSQEDKKSMKEATNSLLQNNQLDNANTLDAINQIKQMSEMAKAQNDTLDTGKKYLTGRKEIYNKYSKVKEFDNTVVEQAKDIVPANKQGKRTKEQWLQVAKQIGTNVADMSNSEIQKIAYKSWQEETPNNVGTLNRQGKKYVKFTSDEWIDTIYDQVENIRKQKGYISQNQTVTDLDTLANELNQIQQSQTIQKQSKTYANTDNMDLIQSANVYGLDSNSETIQSINDKMNDRGIKSRFDETLFKDNKTNAIWKTTKDSNGNIQREVIFNPNADTEKTMQQVSIHEMLHDFEGTKEFNELSNLILEKNKTRKGYAQARQQLEEVYSQVYDKNSKEFIDLVNEEEIADTLAQKLGDQEFINSLNKEKPTVFKKVYNWIVDKLNKITGNRSEKLYWENIRNKFESAYKQDYQSNVKKTKYSKSFDATGIDNLNNASTVFFRKKDNGSIYVQATSPSGEVTYDGTFINEKSLKKSFGEEIAKYISENSELNINNEINITSNNITKETDYMMAHRPTESGAYASNISETKEGNYMPSDVYEHPEYYFNMQKDYSKESFNILKKIKDNPNAEITIYRATVGNKINEGDWVTLSKKYAEMHNNSQLDGKGNIVELKVKANDIQFAGDDINEFGYFPQKDINTDNKAPTTNKDIRYSTEKGGAWQDFLNEQIGTTGKGKTIQQLKLPIKETINKTDAYNILYKNNNVKQKTLNLPIQKGTKQRKTYKSIIESENTSPESKAIAKELIGSETYVPDSNKNQLKRADERIEKNGADNEAISLATKVKNNDKITADDIAVGDRLIEYYSKIGDKEKLQDTIQNVALAGTQAGQAVQAMSLLSRQTPQGQAIYLQKVVDRMNNNIEKRTKGKGKKFNLTPEMIEKITNSSKENLEKNTTEVAMELAKQVPKTTMEKIDSWRYFSMLANPRTHIRNIIGNFSMSGVQSIKSKIAGGLEAVAQKTGMIDERTKTLKPASREVKQFAKQDTQNVMARLNNESKFDAKNIIQQYQRTFKSSLLENTLGKAFNLNSKALEMEDVFGLRRAYAKAMSDYMTANKLTPKELTSGTKQADIQLEKARKYAVEQAQEATFHQQSALASSIAQFENKSKARRLILGSILPFKKTPINVAKTGIEYSPIGLVKAFTTDVVKLNKGEITAAKYIDNLAKGLTGTGIAMVGYALSQAGILSASSDDDDSKKEWYSQDRGNQPFSIKIGDKTYSLDWLSPTAIPLFIGAEINTNVKNALENNEQKTEDILDRLANSIDGMTKAINPMVEMSMLSGLASTIKSFAQGDTQVFSNLMLNSAKSYINQFFPTLGGQIAKTIDTTERSTTSTKKNALAKAVDSTGKQILNKIPFASKMLPAKTDVWGNELKRDSNPLYRALQQSIFPWTEKSLKSTVVDNSISDLYEETGDNSVLPNTSINKDFTINSEKYRLTSEEYAKYKKEYGNTSYELLDSLVSSKEYKNMTTEQKTKAISEIYSYANENNKMNYAYINNIKDVKTSTLYDTVKSIEESNGKGADYFKYLGKTLDLEKDKYKLNELEKLEISTTSKKAIYKNTLGKSDDLYNNVLSKSNININEYLKYKQQEFTSDKKDDGTVQGKTITNSKKTKVYDYINKMNITRTQKILLLGKSYKLNRSEQIELYNYINSIPGQTKSEKLDIFEEYGSNFTVYKNGNISYK